MRPLSDKPLFAVVGHPNKGKSSIVATLAHDDRIAIDEVPQTTTRAHYHPLQVDGQTLYTLVDTPGFQRARRALDWLQRHETSAAERPATVEWFVEAHRAAGQFPDEIELLTPIIEGAGILYVVDGSVPYGEEYKAEMEVLQWTGRPRMALINPIGPADHIEQWRNALDQHFNNVRVFNAVSADFDKQLEILNAFSQLREAWRAPLQQAVDVLTEQRRRARRQSSEAIADMLIEMLRLSVSRTLGPDDDAEPYKRTLEEEYRRKLRQLEQRCRDAVEAAYEHHRLERVESDVELAEDLFSERSWVLFGLSKWQLVALGGAGAGAAGAGVDAALGGLTFGVFTAIGAAAGAGTAWWSSRKLPEARVLWHRAGGKRVRCGPIGQSHFPYVVLNRALHHHALIAGRSHAQRTTLRVQEDANSTDQSSAAYGALNRINEAERRRLTSLIRGFAGGRMIDERERESLINTIERLLE